MAGSCAPPPYRIRTDCPRRSDDATRSGHGHTHLLHSDHCTDGDRAPSPTRRAASPSRCSEGSDKTYRHYFPRLRAQRATSSRQGDWLTIQHVGPRPHQLLRAAGSRNSRSASAPIPLRPLDSRRERTLRNGESCRYVGLLIDHQAASAPRPSSRLGVGTTLHGFQQPVHLRVQPDLDPNIDADPRRTAATIRCSRVCVRR